MRNSLHHKIEKLKTLPAAGRPRSLRRHKIYNIVLTHLLAVVCLTVFYNTLKPHAPITRAQVKSTEYDIEVALPMALDMFEIENGGYPSTAQGLRALIDKPEAGTGSGDTWNGPYLKRRQIPTDSWGTEFVYISPGRHHPDSFDLSSLGPDGVPSADDIVNGESADRNGLALGHPNRDVFFAALFTTIIVMIIFECFVNERGWDKPFSSKPFVRDFIWHWGPVMMLVAWIIAAILSPPWALYLPLILLGPFNIFLGTAHGLISSETLLILGIIGINVAYLAAYPLTRSPRGLILSGIGLTVWLFFGFGTYLHFG